MKKKKFDRGVINYFKSKDYKINSAKEYYKGRRKPDFVAVKGNEILIIETKSPSESKNNSWLYTYKGDYLKKCRAKCKRLNKKLEKGIAKWMVVISGQLWYYIMNIDEAWKSPIPVTKIIVPVLAFPVDQKERVQKALKKLKLSDKRIKKIPDQEKMLLFLNRDELLKITW